VRKVDTGRRLPDTTLEVLAGNHDRLIGRRIAPGEGAEMLSKGLDLLERVPDPAIVRRIAGRRGKAHLGLGARQRGSVTTNHTRSLRRAEQSVKLFLLMGLLPEFMHAVEKVLAVGEDVF
jgi:hypothetical protein